MGSRDLLMFILSLAALGALSMAFVPLVRAVARRIEGTAGAATRRS